MKRAHRWTGVLAFVRTVESGSFSGAARHGGTTPSAVSRVIERLERQLGAKLFHRTTRLLSLTEEGAAYYERVAPLLRALEDVGEIFEDKGNTGTRGKLRVSLPVAIAPLLVDALTADFMVHHPAIALEISVTDRHVDMTREGFDILLTFGGGMTDGTTTCLIANLPITLAAAPAYLDRHGYPRSPEELGGAAHIRHLVAERPRPIVFADGSKLMARGVFDTDSMEAMRVAALRGLGIASLPRLIIAEDLRAGRLLEIVPHASLTPVVLHMRHAFGPFLPRRAILLTEFIKNVLMSRADRT
ncbi:LysR family transcriptional regulator [Sphingopyxis fribergensis]|nr:LysR family transcriptional regulator [Sphingopyxis fribergensis]